MSNKAKKWASYSEGLAALRANISEGGIDFLATLFKATPEQVKDDLSKPPEEKVKAPKDASVVGEIPQTNGEAPAAPAATEEAPAATEAQQG